MPTWTRKPQETDGDHQFNSRTVITRAAQASITSAELLHLSTALRQAISDHDGLDYLQVFECEDGRVIWVIDDGEYVTWLLPEDY